LWERVPGVRGMGGTPIFGFGFGFGFGLGLGLGLGLGFGFGIYGLGLVGVGRAGLEGLRFQLKGVECRV